MIYAAVLAGGTGTRMGADKPKQFLEFAGRPVIIHTTEHFLRHEQIDRVIVVTPEIWCGYTEQLMEEYFGDSGIIVVAGGETRNETLMNAIAAIEAEGGLDDDTVIVTHDAVRPFVTEEMISGNILAAQETGACETAFPSTDTILETDDGRLVKSVPDRSRLWMVQTPQSFRAKKLRELYRSLTEEEKSVLTDAARIYVMKGEPVAIVMGDSSNIKITYPDDIQIAESIWNRQHKQD
ncbi:MAG: 2-C-methyl-D-erythritol 4-phosphate cytidylyltransferase [Mogibacterium sp.]|nr:2-C-methyl-D-erythritol 4-phosphate cytidylyltransferase [Mogibacterium sp.]